MKNVVKRANEMDRRRFMARAAGSFLGVSAVPMFAHLHGTAFGALGPKQEIPPNVGTAKRMIYLYMGGGMTHLDTFDPKPGHENQGPTRALDTNVEGIQFTENLPLLSNHADKLAVVRGMTSTAGAHAQGNYFMHTSYEQRATIRHPGLGAWLTKTQGRLNPNLPGSVFVGPNSRINGGKGFFESEYQPLAINDPNGGLKYSRRNRRMTQSEFEDGLALSGKFDAAFHQRYDVKKVRAYGHMYDDATRIMTSADLSAFDLNEESEATREIYGEHPFGQGCLLARRLIENDVRSVEVSLGGWDTHSNNFITVPEKTAILDQALAALLNDLEVRGLLADTMVVLATEFGRTPKINKNAGRDHYPKAFSCALAGGGVRGGIVHGKTSAGGGKVIENAVKIPDFNATVAHAMGIPLKHVIYSPSKRPFTVTDKGVPVTDLLA